MYQCALYTYKNDIKHYSYAGFKFHVFKKTFYSRNLGATLTQNTWSMQSLFWNEKRLEKNFK